MKTIVAVMVVVSFITPAFSQQIPHVIHHPGEVITGVNLACRDSDDTLEIGVTIDRNLKNMNEIIVEKIVSFKCWLLPEITGGVSGKLVAMVDTAEKTDVWSVTIDGQDGLFYVPFDHQKIDQGL